MTVWVVRAGKEGRREDHAISQGVVVVGWDFVPDLTGMPRDAIAQALEETYQDAGDGTIKNWTSQLHAFVNRMNVGDIVILPRKRTSTVAIGRIAGGYTFDAEGAEGTRHSRPVQWVLTDLPRQRIDSDLRFSIGGAMTVFSVSRNEAENRFEALLAGRREGPALTTASEDATEEAAVENADLERIGLDRISDLISRRFRGHELERLVEGVLAAQGFVTDRTTEGADGGVDIVAGRGRLGLEAPRLCVQVKSQDAPLDVTAIRELQGVLSTFGADMGLIVCWGGFKSTAERLARQQFFKLRLWDSDELIRQLVACYEEIDEELRSELPLKRIWTVVSDD